MREIVEVERLIPQRTVEQIEGPFGQARWKFRFSVWVRDRGGGANQSPERVQQVQRRIAEQIVDVPVLDLIPHGGSSVCGRATQRS